MHGLIKKDLTGKTFGKLEVLGFCSWVTHGKNPRVSYWKCRCICGNIKSIKGTHLTRGDTKSCGCYKPNKLPLGEANLNVVYSGYKRHAKNRGLVWNITKNDFRTITSCDCYYCGSGPSNSNKGPRSNGAFIYNGIDRVDNTEGYTHGNIVPCCGQCNRMKSNLSKFEFLEIIRKIYERTNKS